MAHCLAGRSHRRLLTDIIAGRCVSGANRERPRPVRRRRVNRRDSARTECMPRVPSPPPPPRHRGIARLLLSTENSRTIQIRTVSIIKLSRSWCCVYVARRATGTANSPLPPPPRCLKRKRKSTFPPCFGVSRFVLLSLTGHRKRRDFCLFIEQQQFTIFIF